MSKTFNKALNYNFLGNISLGTAGNIVAPGNSNTVGNIFTTGGNVGIGTTSPSSTLHLVSNAADTLLNMTCTTSGSNTLIFNSTATSRYSDLYFSPNESIYFRQRSGGSYPVRLIIDTGGNVGIGTTSPIGTLDVSGTASFTTSVTSGALYATNITATNIVGTTSISTGTLVATTRVSAANLNSSIINTRTLLATDSTISNLRTSSLQSSSYIQTPLLIGWNSILNVESGTNVGIGTTSPVGILDVRDPTNFVGDDGGALYITGGTNGNRRLHMGYANTNNYGWIEVVEKGVNLQTLSLQPRSGSVGIGTTSPGYRLDVAGDIRTFVNNTRSSLYVGNGTYDAAINLWDGAGAAWQLRTGSFNLSIGNGTIGGTINTRLTINSVGNVGIGTGSPGYTMHLANSATAGNISGFSNFAPNMTAGSRLLSIIGKDSGVQNGFYTWYEHVGDNNTGNYLHWDANGQNNIFVIKGNGTVGIGSTSPTQALEVNGSVRIGNNNVYNKLLVLWDSSTSDAVASATSFYGFGINNSTLRYQTDGTGSAHRFYNGATNYYQITSAGGANVSDRRYKSDIVNINDALNKITQLQGITFKMQDIEKRQMGFVAQDVESVVPEVVQVGDDDTRFMSYDKLTALLVEGIKEQKTTIDNQQTQIDQLKQFIQSKFPGEFNQ